MTDPKMLARRFETERPRLRAIATQLLGSGADADDAVQETWLRLERADAAGIDNLEAWLTTVVSRISLDQLRAPRRKREHSWQVEPWRDEPVAAEADPAELVARSDQVSVALLVLLETLSPAERIALVLHDVFGQSFDEIAVAVDKSPAAVRQIAHRAKDHVAARRPRMDVVRSEHEEAVERLVAALNTGDLQGLMDVLAPDVVSVADGGGKVRGAARRPVVGADRIARSLVGGLSKAAGRVVASVMWLNGNPGVRVELDGQLAGVLSLSVEGGRITRMYATANPDKLGWVEAEAELAR
jgi:RNA polymerase sigma factor (sigma-70 family)